MNVQQVVTLAVQSELSNLSVKTDTDAVLGYINLGLIELYKRFTLNVKEHIVELQDGIEVYDMPDDFMWLIAAYDEVPETSVDIVAVIPVNVEDDPLSINTVNWNQVQVPITVAGSYISIIYSAAPPILTTDDLTITMPLPLQLTEALLHYVGYRGHAAMDGSIQAENNTHYQRFEASCNNAKRDGVLTSDDMDMGIRLNNRGFV